MSLTTQMAAYEAAIFKDHDFMLPQWRKAGRRLLRLGLARWDPVWDQQTDMDEQAFRRQLRDDYTATYGNPLIWLWVLSTVISLLWQWWLQRDKHTRADELQTMRDVIARASGIT
jgi:hypothetical protein